MQNSSAHFIVSCVHVCITTFSNCMKTMGSPNDTQGLPFPTKLLCLTHLCIFFLKTATAGLTLSNPGARGLAGLATTRHLPYQNLACSGRRGPPLCPTPQNQLRLLAGQKHGPKHQHTMNTKLGPPGWPTRSRHLNLPHDRLIANRLCGVATS